MQTLRFFSNGDVAARLDYPALIEALRSGLTQACDAPLRRCLAPPGDASLLSMPVWQAGQGIGVKLVTVFPGNGAPRPAGRVKAKADCRLRELNGTGGGIGLGTGYLESIE